MLALVQSLPYQHAPSRAWPALPSMYKALRNLCAVYAIFGATGGIGSELAHRLAKQPGAHVMAAADTKESLGQLEGEIKDLHAVACYVLKQDTVRRSCTAQGCAVLEGSHSLTGKLCLPAPIEQQVWII